MGGEATIGGEKKRRLEPLQVILIWDGIMQTAEKDTTDDSDDDDGCRFRI